MNRLLLWLINAVLLLLACAVTAWVVGQAPTAALSDPKDDTKPARAERKSERKSAAKEPGELGLRQGTASAEDADTLWQQTLFRPERTEDVTQPAVEDAAAVAAPVDLELVGLAKINDRAVAVIVQYRNQPRRPNPGAAPGAPPGVAPLRRPAGARPAPARPAAPGAEAAPEGPPDRHVYKVGDKVGDSGYALKEIRLKEKEAVLVRGSEERVLKLDDTDDQSKNRREQAAAQAAQAEKAAQAVAAKPPAEVPQPGAAKPPGEAGTTPPPPPPPPVAAGVLPGAPVAAVPGGVVPGSDGAPVVPMTREERLERARLLRERILQGRPPTNTTN